VIIKSGVLIEERSVIMAETEQKIKEAISRFILDSINLRDLKEDDHLFETGIVNSLFAVQLMTFIEKTFAIEIGSDDLDIENFKSIKSTSEFVLKKNGRIAA
jgi:methoxymalonate biosynthesis acyl carrier protein